MLQPGETQMQVVEHLGGIEPADPRYTRERIAEAARPLAETLDLVLPACGAAGSSGSRKERRRQPRPGVGREVVAQVDSGLGDPALADQNFFGGLYPRVGRLHIRPVAINGYPAETIPQLLWFILHERGRMRFTLRWIPLDAITSQRHGNQVRGQWARRRQGLLQIILAAMNVPRTRGNRHADEMVADAEEVTARAAGGTPFGFLSLWAHIFDEDEARADLRAREMVRRLQNAGAGARVEDGTRSRLSRARSRATAGPT
jgi:hypothetical protein